MEEGGSGCLKKEKGKKICKDSKSTKRIDNKMST